MISEKKKKILVLGGGFGGVRVLKSLSAKIDRSRYDLILIDKNKSQTYLPLLYELGSLYGYEHDHPFHKKIISLLSLDFEVIFNKSHVKIIQAEVSSFSFKESRVQLNSGEYIDFDYLVIALGSVYDDLGVEGVNAYSYPFKTIDNAISVNDKMEEIINSHYQKYHRGSVSASDVNHEKININIVGGGPNGIEVAGELASGSIHFGHDHGFDIAECINFRIFEAYKIAGNNLKLRNLVLKRLQSIDVDVVEGVAISQVNGDSLVLKNGLLFKSDLTIWTAGVKSPRIIEKNHEIEISNKKRIIVEDNMAIKGYDNVFAIGDCAHIADESGNIANLIMSEALSQADIVVNNILYKEKFIAKENQYRSSQKLFIMPIGGKYSIMMFGGRVYAGFLPFLFREAVNLRYFLSVFPFFNAIRYYLYLFKIFSRND